MEMNISTKAQVQKCENEKFEKFASISPPNLKCRLSSVFVVIVYIRGGITIHCKIFIFIIESKRVVSSSS